MQRDPNLNAIASMEFGKAVNRLRKEKETKMRIALAGLSGGGPHLAAKREIELEYAEQTLVALAEIWVNLLEGTNGGILTRQHVDFIKGQVQGAASARRSALMNGPPMASNQQAVAGHVARQMAIVTGNVVRDLELRLKRQEVGLPKGEPMKEVINLTVHNAANINLGSQVGTINAALNVITQKGQGEIAAALKELSEAIVRNGEIKDREKQEALQVVSELAKQAVAEPDARSTGTVRALIAGFPMMIGLAADVTTLWDKFGPIVRAYFGI
jgi:hypothetical protein